MNYNQGLYRELNKKAQDLMDIITESGNDGFYSYKVHNFLQKESIYGVGQLNRNVILPMPMGEWYPKNKIMDWREYYSAVAPDMGWPEYSLYAYGMDMIQSNLPGFLYHGYAIYENKLVPCSFIVQFLMTRELDGYPGEFFPDEYVMDPLALYSEKNPEGYIGVMVPYTLIEDWLVSRNRQKAKHPLEIYIEEYNNGRFHDSKWQQDILIAEQELIKGIPEDKREDALKWLGCRGL